MSERASLKDRAVESERDDSLSHMEKSEFVPTTDSPHAHIASLHNTIGNRALYDLFKAGALQQELRVSEPLPVANKNQEGSLEKKPTKGNQRFDWSSTATIQQIVQSGITGIFDAATMRAIIQFQKAHGLSEQKSTGVIGDETLDLLMTACVERGWHDAAIHLVVDADDDLERRIQKGVLTVHWINDPDAKFITDVEIGGLRKIAIGTTAFTSAKDLHDTIEEALIVPKAAETLIVPDEEPSKRTAKAAPVQKKSAAIFANRKRFKDVRSALAIQGLLSSDLTGAFDDTTITKIVEYQREKKLSDEEKGFIKELTLNEMFKDLLLRDQQDAIIRIIIDYYDMNTHGALLDIYYNPSPKLEANAAATPIKVPGPSIIEIGENAFKDIAFLAHTIKHELEHVRQFKEGIKGPAGDFLAEKVELLMAMPRQQFKDFKEDAASALEAWENMSEKDREIYAQDFLDGYQAIIARNNNEPHENANILRNLLDKYEKFAGQAKRAAQQKKAKSQQRKTNNGR